MGGLEPGGSPSANPAWRTLGTHQPGSQISDVGTSVPVRLGLSVELPEVSTGPPGTIHFLDRMQWGGPVAARGANKALRSICANSALAAFSLAGYSLLYLAATGLPVVSM